jgi:hypothetical protein
LEYYQRFAAGFAGHSPLLVADFQKLKILKEDGMTRFRRHDALITGRSLKASDSVQ